MILTPLGRRIHWGDRMRMVSGDGRICTDSRGSQELCDGKSLHSAQQAKAAFYTINKDLPDVRYLTDETRSGSLYCARNSARLCSAKSSPGYTAGHTANNDPGGREYSIKPSTRDEA